MELIIMVLIPISVFVSFWAHIYTSFQFVMLGNRDSDRSLQIMGSVGFLLLMSLISLVVIEVLFYRSYSIGAPLLVFSIILAIYIGVLSFIFTKKFNNPVVGVFGIFMCLFSLLMGMSSFSSSNDPGLGSLMVIFYAIALGAVFTVTSMISFTFLRSYKKNKKSDLIYKMTGKKIDNL